ncbi:MAG: OprO/OprP family phosphate-selective porin [Nitrospinota bacterium]|nr:OprO/OprP family phosphate-selective porin [Nitrospinota bacterium]
MKQILSLAGVCVLVGSMLCSTALAQQAPVSKKQETDILIIEEDSGGDDILIIEEDSSGSVADLQEEIDRLATEIDDMRDLFGTLRKNVNVTGYGETHFNLPTDNRDNVFDAHRFVLGVNARFNDWIFLNAEIDYEHAAQALEFEMAYLDFLLDPKFNARAGTVLIPVGFLNEFHEPVLFWTVERPVFHNRVVPTSWNGTGGGFFGTFGNFLGGMNYRVYLVNSLRSIQTNPCDSAHGGGGDCGQFKGSSGVRSGRAFPDELVASDYALTGRVEFSNLFPGLQLAGSFYTGNTTQGLIPQNGRTTIIEGDIKYRYKWLDMNASIANVHINNAAELNSFAIAQGNASGNIASNILGWNIQAGIHWPQLLGKSTSHDVVTHFMYEFIDTQNEMPAGFAPNTGSGGETDVYTAGITWFPSTTNVSLKMDYTHQRFQNGTSTDQVNFGMAYMFF